MCYIFQFDEFFSNLINKNIIIIDLPKKLAGLPPCSLIMSMVAIAKPAPLTMQPISPSKAM